MIAAVSAESQHGAVWCSRGAVALRSYLCSTALHTPTNQHRRKPGKAPATSQYGAAVWCSTMRQYFATSRSVVQSVWVASLVQPLSMCRQAVWCSKWCSKWCSLAPSCRQRFHESHECMPFHGLPSYTTRCSLEGTVRRGKEGKRKRQCDDVNVYSFDKHTSA